MSSQTFLKSSIFSLQISYLCWKQETQFQVWATFRRGGGGRVRQWVRRSTFSTASASSPGSPSSPGSQRASGIVSLPHLGGCPQQGAVVRSRGCGVECRPVLCTMDYLEGWYYVPHRQGFGSGSAWIRINLSCWIRIRIQEGKNEPQK